MTRTSFYYDPIRQGFDTNLWKVITGATPVIAAGRLTLKGAAIIHYADVKKGEYNFNLNIPDAPGGDDGRVFGLYAPNSGAFIVFQIGSILSGEVADGLGNSQTTGSILWDSAWQGANINFKIRWEAGTAKFFIQGTQVGAITDVAVPAGPLSLYVTDFSVGAMSVGDVSAVGIQEYVLNAKSADSNTYADSLLISQTVTVTEGITMKIPTIMIPYGDGIATMFDAVAVSENVAVAVTVKPSVSDNVTITENFSKAIV